MSPAAGGAVPAGSAAGPPAAAGSGSGVPPGCPVCESGSGSKDPCEIGFDLLMFEYAHLVLFWMGLTYCAFIQIAFFQRDRFTREIASFQRDSTLYQHYAKCRGGWKGFSVMAIMGIGAADKWARGVLVLRSALVLHHFEEIKQACDIHEEMMVQQLARYRRKDPPAPLPAPEVSHEYFDIARFSKVALSSTLCDLLHVPPSVWLCIIVMSMTNVLHGALNVDLAYMTLVSALFGPLLGLVLLERMSSHLKTVVVNAVGHPDILKYEYFNAQGDRAPEGFVLPAPEKQAGPGREWAKGGPHPWAELDGCCEDDSAFNACDPLDPGALEVQMQVIIFASCFYVGTIMMLTTLVVDHVGVVVCIVCWVLPFFPLLWLIPRSILIFALVHRGVHPENEWLQYSCKEKDDPVEHGHGHGGGHGHGDDHGHEHHDEHDRIGALKKLSKHLLTVPGVEDPSLSSPKQQLVEVKELDVHGTGNGPSSTISGVHQPLLPASTMGSMTQHHRQHGEHHPASHPSAEGDLSLPPPGPAYRHLSEASPGMRRSGGHSDKGLPSVGRRVRRRDSDGAPLHSTHGGATSPTRAASQLHEAHPPPSRRHRGDRTAEDAPVPCCPGCGGRRLLPDTPGAVMCQDCGQRMVAPPGAVPRSPGHRTRHHRHHTHMHGRGSDDHDSPHHSQGTRSLTTRRSESPGAVGSTSPRLAGAQSFRSQPDSHQPDSPNSPYSTDPHRPLNRRHRQASEQHRHHSGDGPAPRQHSHHGGPHGHSSHAHPRGGASNGPSGCQNCGSMHTVLRSDGGILCHKCGQIS